MADIVSKIKAKRSVTTEDVLVLRSLIYGKSKVSVEAAEMLFEINGALDSSSPSWGKLFVEALGDYLVDAAEPEGYISEENAAWFMARVSADGVIHRGSELEALVTILERATSAPEQLSGFALQQVREAVLSGTGAGRWGRPGVVAIITAEDVKLLRRILYAFAGEGHIAVTRSEAEVLFDLNDRTIEAENHPDWSDLFVKAIANSLMFASGYQVPTRQQALQRSEWIADTSIELGGFFSRMFRSNAESVRAAYSRPADEVAIAAEQVTEGEAHWLAERIGRDGVLHENEKALLHFIREEAPEMPPVLQTLVDSAA